MSNHRLQRLIDDLNVDLLRISERFKGDPKLTLVVRNPTLPDGDLVLTDDDLDAAIEAIRRLQREQEKPEGKP